MKKIKKNFLEWNNHVLVSSIKKINLNIILIIILDGVFYFLAGFFIQQWFDRVQAKMSSFVLPQDIVSLGYESVQELVGEVRAFYYILVFSFILLLTAMIFLASMLKGIIWAKTTKTKVTFELISKFVGLNLIWMGFWLVMLFIDFKLVLPSLVLPFLIGGAIISIYFTNIIYAVFMKKHHISAIKDGTKIGITKIHLLILPYIIIFVILFLLERLFSFVQFTYSFAVVVVILLIYAAIVRYYVSTLVYKIQKSV